MIFSENQTHVIKIITNNYVLIMIFKIVKRGVIWQLDPEQSTKCP